MLVTIDGPAGCGKTTIAKEVARKLSWAHYDTGAMYRAVTLLLIEKKIPFSESEEIARALENLSFDVREQNGDKHYFLGDRDVTGAIRSQKVNENVSEVAAMREVRRILWKMQRDLAKKQNAVFEGRDMGSIVFPNAEVKIFLDAKPHIRAQRRLKQMQKNLPKEAEKINEKKMLGEIKRRDEFDASRQLAPLTCPKGAYRIDTSDLSPDQVVERILKRHKKFVKRLLPLWLRGKKVGFFYRVMIFFAWLTFKILYQHRIYGLEHFTNRAAILAPNHTSYWDPPLTAVSWPAEIHFLARESLFRFFVFGPFIRALNSHPIRGDVGDVSVFKTIIQLLKQGKQLVLFPEGGRSFKDELGEIKPGIGMLLMRSESVIVPTYIHGAHKVWNRKKKLPRLFGRTACVFGKPILWESFVHLSKKEAQLAIAKKLEESMEALRKWYTDGADGVPP